MSFENLNILYLLLSIIGVVLVYLSYKKYNSILQLLSLDSERRKKGELYLSITIYILILIALFGPQYGFRIQKVKKQGADIVIALDISKSMLARDVAPDRLSRAKKWIEEFSKTIEGDRLGLVSFSGVSFIESPLTLDKDTFVEFVRKALPEISPVDGTDIELALEKSINLIDFTKKSFSNRDSAIVLITDGENFSQDLESIAESLKENQIKLFVLGVGTKKGDKIPTQRGYKRDRLGKEVITRLNEAVLNQLANEVGGQYINLLESPLSIKEFYQNFIKPSLSSSELADGSKKIWNNYFQIPLFLAILLFMTRFIFYRR